MANNKHVGGISRVRACSNETMNAFSASESGKLRRYGPYLDEADSRLAKPSDESQAYPVGSTLKGVLEWLLHPKVMAGVWYG